MWTVLWSFSSKLNVYFQIVVMASTGYSAFTCRPSSRRMLEMSLSFSLLRCDYFLLGICRDDPGRWQKLVTLHTLFDNSYCMHGYCGDGDIITLMMKTSGNNCHSQQQYHFHRGWLSWGRHTSWLSRKATEIEDTMLDQSPLPIIDIGLELRVHSLPPGGIGATCNGEK